MSNNNNKSKTDQSKEKLLKVQSQVDNLTETMRQNIILATDNTVQLDALETKTDELNRNSFVFGSESKKLKNKLWWKKVKLWILLGSFFAIMLTIIITVCVLSSQNNNKSSAQIAQEIGKNFIEFVSEFVFDRYNKYVTYAANIKFPSIRSNNYGENLRGTSIH